MSWASLARSTPHVALDPSSASGSPMSGPSLAGNGSITGSRSVTSSPPPARFSADSAAAEERGVLRGDRQPEAGAALVARDVGLVEPVEQVARARPPGRRARDRRPGRVARPPASSATVTSTGELRAHAPGRCRAGCRRSGRGGGRPPRRRPARPAAWSSAPGQPARDDRPNGRDEVDRLQLRLLGPGVEPGQLHEVVDEDPQPADVGDEQLPGAPGVRRQFREAGLDDRRLRDERGQRGPQLVRDVGDEPPVLALRSLEARDRRRERVGHAVELRGESRELVGAAGGHARREVAGGDPGRGGAPGDRPAGGSRARRSPRSRARGRWRRARRRPARAAAAPAPPRSNRAGKTK